MSVCLVINEVTQTVVNRIVASPTDVAPVGCYLVEQTDMSVDIGWAWDGQNFVNPNPPVEGVPE